MEIESFVILIDEVNILGKPCLIMFPLSSCMQ